MNWDSKRYEMIVEELRHFLVQSGFLASKTKLVPVSAMAGTNLVARDSTGVLTWYNGPTLVDLLGTIIRNITLNKTHQAIPFDNR